MKVVTYNIQYSLGRNGSYDLDRIASEVDGADIIALQEIERHWQRSGVTDQVDALADKLPDHHWVYGPNVDMDASYRDETGRLIRRRRQFGNMVLSRYPILSTRNFPLPKRALIDQHSVQKGLLETVIAAPDGPIRIYCTHLCHLCEQTRMPQVREILDIVARAPAEGGAWCGSHPNPEAGWTEGEMPPMPAPFLILGDMNFTNKDFEYETIVGPYAPGYGRLVNPQGVIDAWVAAGHDEDDGATRDERRIDHCFASADLRDRIVDMRVDSSASGSDHLPVWISLES